MQGFCERFLRFLAGEDPDSAVCDCSSGSPGITNEIRDSDAAVAVSKQMQTRHLLN